MNELFRIDKDEPITEKVVEKFLIKNISLNTEHYEKMKNAYENDYEIFHLPKKAKGKPDNRIAVNFAKYITDTMNGFFLGIPVKYDSKDEKIKKELEFFNAFNSIEDHDAELSKICSIYGRAYEIYFVDDDGNLGIKEIPPSESFMIYDNSILTRSKAFVRYYKNEEGKICGSVSDDTKITYFEYDKEVKFVYDTEKKEGKTHGFHGVPAVEYVENKERMGIYESALSMVNEFNKAISEKANDVDYFADAYMKVIGPKLDESSLSVIRDNRIINFEGDDKVVVDFMAKPNADTTQENLINRLERLIFITSMVANVSDEQFATSSGIALKYRLLAMNNLAKTKERKFVAGFNKRYKLIFSNPTMTANNDDWMKITYQFTRNYPVNLADEVETASKMSGVTSKRTQLSVVSAVKNVDEEFKLIEEEQDLSSLKIDYPTERTAED